MLTTHVHRAVYGEQQREVKLQKETKKKNTHIPTDSEYVIYTHVYRVDAQDIATIYLFIYLFFIRLVGLILLYVE